MSHPRIQIVDENDNPIGSMLLSDAHDKGSIHRIVRIMLEDPKSDRVLLQKRSPNMKSWPNCWDHSAAGHVDEGEDYLTAAKRELSEELGIKIYGLDEIGKYYSENRRQDGLVLKRFNMVYKAKFEDQDFKIQESEVSEVKWFSIEEAKRLIKNNPDDVTDGLKDVISKYYK